MSYVSKSERTENESPTRTQKRVSNPENVLQIIQSNETAFIDLESRKFNIFKSMDIVGREKLLPSMTINVINKLGLQGVV